MTTRRAWLGMAAGGALAPALEQASPDLRVASLDDFARAQIGPSIRTVLVERFGPGKPDCPMIWTEAPGRGPPRPWERLSNRGARRWRLTSPIVAPEMFGAEGNGRHDDYQAFQDLSACCSDRRGGHVRLTRGRTYYIGRVRIYGGPDQNDVTFITFTDCDGLVIDGDGATISCKGDFHRAPGPPGNSFWNSVIPIRILGGRNVTIRDLRVVQNVRQMTRPGPEVAEGYAHGIVLQGVNGARLERVRAEGSPTDGLMVHEDQRTRPYRVSRNIVLIDCAFEENSRLGMAVVGCVGLRATGCSFSNNGHAGRYGNTAPSAGVDIEPDYAPPQTESITTDIVFERCRFDGNLGGPLIATNPKTTGTVRLIDCTGIADTSLSPIPRMLVNVRRFEMENFRGVNVGLSPGALYAEQGVIAMQGRARGCVFDGDHPAFQPIVQDYAVGPAFTFEDCTFRLTARAPSPLMRQGSYQILLGGSSSRVRRCRLYCSAALHPGGDDPRLLIAIKGAEVDGLKIETDLRPPRRYLVHLDPGRPRAARQDGVELASPALVRG